MKITVEEFVAFVNKNAGLTFPTSGGNTSFRIESRTTGVRFIPAGTGARNVNQNALQRYVDVFNITSSVRMALDDRPNMRDRSYVLAILQEIRKEKINLEKSLCTIPEEEKEILYAPETEQEALLKSRLGQGKFREELIDLRKCCYVTGITGAQFLRASHIKPWSESSNVERLDPRNGLLLCPNYDHLFDLGLISFTDEGKILVSSKIPKSIINTFGINVSFKGRDLGEKTKVYLAHHRNRFHQRQKSNV